MGYTTDFEGSVTIEPPLNQEELDFLAKFAHSRRMKRTSGPYTVDGSDGWCTTDEDGDVLDYNCPPDGQPGLWCQWVPTEDGDALVWDGNEKFYESEGWMRYLIEHFLMEGAIAKDALPFLQANHVINGEIFAAGEDSDDRWKLVVEDNCVTRVEGKIVYER